MTSPPPLHQISLTISPTTPQCPTLSTITMKHHIGLRCNVCHHGVKTITLKKTKEIIVDFRRNGQQNHFPLFIDGEAVERVCNIKYLGVNISEDLSGSINISSAVGKAQQHLYYLRKLRSAQITKRLMVNIYNCAISRVLTLRFSSCTKADQQTLQRAVKTAGKITGAISAIYTTHCLRSGWSEDHT